MVAVSKGCINECSYGLSCDFCGKCGRQFTKNGIDDSQVKSKNLNFKIPVEFIVENNVIKVRRIVGVESI